MEFALKGQADRLDEQPGSLGDLVARAGSGQEAAWAELVGMYGRRLFALARSRLRDSHAAEEVVQSVFVTVATKLRDGGYAEAGRFEAWLFRVTMNRVRDEIRRRKHRPSATDPGHFVHERAEAEPGFDEHEAGRSELARMREAMTQLPDADREVVELRHHGQMSFKQMSVLLDEPVGTLLARHHRALRKLRAIMEAEPIGEQSGSEE